MADPTGVLLLPQLLIAEEPPSVLEATRLATGEHWGPDYSRCHTRPAYFQRQLLVAVGALTGSDLQGGSRLKVARASDG